MDGEHDPADSHRASSLAEKFRDKRYRDSYVGTHARVVLARQMRNFRGERSQAEFAEKLDKQKTMIARLENPAYGGWSLRTMLDVARKNNVAVFVRFVDFPTFLKLSGDLSDEALRPAPYDEEAIDKIVETQNRKDSEQALKALFSGPPPQPSVQKRAQDALSAPPPPSIDSDAEQSKRGVSGELSPSPRPDLPPVPHDKKAA